jgi:hypothetical protein
MRFVRDRAPLRIQCAHSLRASPPRTPHPSALRLGPSTVEAHLALVDEPDATKAACVCIARYAPEHANAFEGAFAHPLFSTRREAQRAPVRHHSAVGRVRALAGILLAFVICPSCWSVCRRATSWCRTVSRIQRAYSYLRFTRRTMACVVVAMDDAAYVLPLLCTRSR